MKSHEKSVPPLMCFEWTISVREILKIKRKRNQGTNEKRTILIVSLSSSIQERAYKLKQSKETY